jgi:hypothetical protein
VKIIVGFSRAKSIFKFGSTAIQLAEKRNFGHAYIRYYSEEKQTEIVAQASHGFVNEMNFDIFKDTNIVVKEYKLECSRDTFDVIMKFIGSKLGTKYSQMQIILIAIKKVLRFEVKQYNQDKYFICSEFAAIICHTLGVDVPTELDYFTPSDLDTLLHENKVELL